MFTYEGLVADRTRYLDRLATFIGVERFDLGPAAAELDVHPGLPNRGPRPPAIAEPLPAHRAEPFPVVDIGVWWRGPIVAVGPPAPPPPPPHSRGVARRARRALPRTERPAREARPDRGLRAVHGDARRARHADADLESRIVKKARTFVGENVAWVQMPRRFFAIPVSSRFCNTVVPDEAIAMPVIPSRCAPMISPPIVATNVIAETIATTGGGGPS